MVINLDNYGGIITKGTFDSYDESYIIDEDVEGMISVEKKKILIKKNKRRLCL
jgi:hypothetical protein